MIEPLVHSYISDGLPTDHKWATESVYCEDCNVMVHAFNNECMQPWIEAEQGNYCFECLHWETLLC